MKWISQYAGALCVAASMGAFFSRTALADRPVIDGVSPRSGTATMAEYPTIYGSNFAMGAKVLIGGVAPRRLSQTGTKYLTFEPPSVGAPGPVSVEVINPDGGSATLVDGFTYRASSSPVAPPVIGGVSPGSGPESRDVTIWGSNFAPGAKVYINGIAPRGLWPNHTTFLTFEPPLSMVLGPVDVEVVNPDGGTASLKDGFSYTSASLTSTDGACGAADGTTIGSAPTANLCATGNASPVSGSGPWSWSCAGSGGGTNASCSAAPSTSTSGSPPAAGACTKYVSPSGSANGILAYTSIQAGVDALNPGDTLCVTAGTYHEVVHVANGGTPTAPIAIQADDPNDPPRIDGEYTLPAGNDAPAGCDATATADRLPRPRYACSNINYLVMISASNVVWDGIDVIHSRGAGLFAGDASLNPPGWVGRTTCCTVHDIQIFNSSFAHERGIGSMIFYVDGAVFSGNDVYDSNNYAAFDRPASDLGWGNGLAVTGMNVTISGNVLHEQFAEPVQLGGFVTVNAGETSADIYTTTAFRSVFNLVLKNNVFYDNWAMNGPYVGNVNGGLIDGNLIYSTGNPVYFRYGSPLNCLAIDSETGINTGPALSNVVFSNNVISNCRNLIAMRQYASNSIYENVSFYNNTLLPSYEGGPAVTNTMTRLSGFAFFNNLIDSPDGPATGSFNAIPGLKSGHNIWSSSPSGVILDPTDIISTDPGLVNGAYAASEGAPAGFDVSAFKLVNGSIAMDDAIGLSAVPRDFFGTVRPAHPDTGAFQH